MKAYKFRTQRKCCSSNIPHTEHIVYAVSPRTSNLLQHQDNMPHRCNRSLTLLKMGKLLPEHVELIQRSIELLLLQLLGHFYYYYYWYSALGPVWAETRVQSGDWYGSGTLHPGQVLLGVACHCFPPLFRCSHFSPPGASTSATT